MTRVRFPSQVASAAAVSTFPEKGCRSACASSFSRLVQRSLSLRPAHARCHQFVTRIPKASASSLPPWLLRLLPAGAIAGWGLHPLESAALSRRTPKADIAKTRFATQHRNDAGNHAGEAVTAERWEISGVDVQHIRHDVQPIVRTAFAADSFRCLRRQMLKAWTSLL